MKNKKYLILFFFSFIFIPITFINAYGPSLGAFGNPLQVEIVPSPGQILDQKMRDQALRLEQQSQENYQNNILNQQHELNQQLIQQRLDSMLPSHNQIITLPKTNDQKCQGGYGLNSNWDGTKNEKDELICSCKSGYQWNSGQTQCVVTPVAPLNIILPNGCNGSRYSTTSGISCDGTNKCGAGSQFNSDKTECVLITTVVPVSGGGGGSTATVTAPKIEKIPEVNIIKEDTKENTPNITKPEIVSTDTKIVPIASEVKHKSLWSKIKGWFGF